MISKGRISHHEEGEPIEFSAYDKRNKGNKKKSAFKSSKGNLDMSKVRCSNCPKHGNFSRDRKERKIYLRFKSKLDYRKDTFENKRKGHPKKTRNPRYRNNAAETQSNYVLVYALSSSSFADSFDHWLVDNGASKHFTGYEEALSNLVEMKTNLNVIPGDNSTHQVKGYGSVSFQLDDGKSIFLQEVLYVPDLQKNLVSISALEDKLMIVSFINGKVLTWPLNSSMRETFTLGSRCKGIYKVNGKPIHALVHDIDLQCEL